MCPSFWPSTATNMALNGQKRRISGEALRPPNPTAYVALIIGRSDREHAQRATAAFDDLERRGDHDRAGGRKLVEIAEAGKAKLAGAMHQRMVRKRRVEGASLARIGADC